MIRGLTGGREPPGNHSWLLVSLEIRVWTPLQGLKIALVRSYLQLPQAAGQVNILINLVKIIFPIHANNFCDAGQVSIL